MRNANASIVKQTLDVILFKVCLFIESIKYQCFPCYMMSEVGDLTVFLSDLAQNMSKLPSHCHFLL